MDASSLPGHMWEGAYLFSPFALVGRCLQFILRHQIFRAVLVAPAWQGQTYYPQLLSVLRGSPWLLPVMKDQVLGPFGESHPMEADRTASRLATIKAAASGQGLSADISRLWVSPWRSSTQSSMSQPGTSGFAGVSGNRWIPWKVMRWL